MSYPDKFADRRLDNGQDCVDTSFLSRPQADYTTATDMSRVLYTTATDMSHIISKFPNKGASSISSEAVSATHVMEKSKGVPI